MLRVVIADDNYLIREGLRHLLDTDPRIVLVAICEDGRQLAETVEAELPDVVVTDIRMPPSGDAEGVIFANRLRDSHPEIGVVVVSQYADPRYALALLDHGSDRRAYLLKDRLRDREHLIAAIYEVAAGGSVVDAKVVEALIAARTAGENSPLSELTRRELELLALIAQGKSNQAIADGAVPEQARGREAHPFDLHEARPRAAGRGEPARQGRADLSSAAVRVARARGRGRRPPSASGRRACGRRRSPGS